MNAELPAVLRPSPDGDGWLADGAPWRAPRGLRGVVGDPVAHSLSPVFQNPALASLGADEDYVRIRVTADEWNRFVDGAHASGLAGCNVTAPHKERAWASCVRRTSAADRVGAVNTLAFDDEGPVGHNTDVGGLEDVLALEGVDAGWDAVVIGAGGAARAAVAALEAAGAGRIGIRARSGPARDAFARWLVDVGSPAEAPLDWTTTGTGSERPVIAVAAVPAGVDVASALPRADRAPERVLLDLRYGRALPAVVPPDWRLRDGASLLLAQGLRSLRWWFGREPAPGPLAAALQAVLDDDAPDHPAPRSDDGS